MIQCSIVTLELDHNSIWNDDPGHNSTWNFDPGSQFHVELWPRVITQRWIVTPGHDSTLNCDPDQDFTVNFDPGHDSTLNCDPGSWFHVELWPQVKLWPGIGITIQCGILTRGHNSTWNFDQGHNSTWNSDPCIYLRPVEMRLKNSTAKEGHNSTKNPLNIEPGSVFNWGVKILSYTGIPPPPPQDGINWCLDHQLAHTIKPQAHYHLILRGGGLGVYA